MCRGLGEEAGELPEHLLYVQRAQTRAERKAALEEERKKRKEAKGDGKGKDAKGVARPRGLGPFDRGAVVHPEPGGGGDRREAAGGLGASTFPRFLGLRPPGSCLAAVSDFVLKSYLKRE